ncbi:uncharacterized protein LOC132749718 isoform X3 [Ruditapes philippinarum]|uniref:uncharacterized protein LOC132749718 isoform X3 n=1 Tax=Ruditapes philippinarum TaxID=129788 RepID=UPI00295BF0A3|nr:uncharacterized protein LOC132749718 isoform X3 [Ruditapes philippinarum]
MDVAKLVCYCTFVTAYFICQTAGDECGDLRERFDRLEKEYSKLHQEKFDQLEREISKLRKQVADIENNAEKERVQRYLLDGEVDIELEVKKLILDVQGIKQDMGSTYVRWGRTECSSNSSVVYKGYTGGKWYRDTGGPANYVCMPEDPQWAEYLDGFQDIGNRMYGTEYEDNYESTFNPFSVHRDNEDAPCVVCRSQRATTVMIPARTSCYNGWHLEYTGYLMTMSRAYHSSSEYICVDKDPEVTAHGSTDKDGNLLYIVEAACGSLPCLPYVDGRELACVVCSK